MSTRAVLALVAALVTLSASVPAAQTAKPPEQVKPEPSKGVKVVPLPNLQPDNPKNPFRDVFGAQMTVPAHTRPVTPQMSVRSAQKPRVMCGIVMIPADPNIDPGIVKLPDLQTRYAIRAIKPPVCLPD